MTGVGEPMEYLKEFFDIGEVKPGGGFIEDEQFAG
jgi:hypothetical protein